MKYHYYICEWFGCWVEIDTAQDRFMRDTLIDMYRHKGKNVKSFRAKISKSEWKGRYC